MLQKDRRRDGLERQLLWLRDKMHTSVFLHARIGMFETEWPVLSETHGVDVEGKSSLLEIGFDAPCPTLTQYQIVGGGAQFVSTTFKNEMCGTVMLQVFDIGV